MPMWKRTRRNLRSCMERQLHLLNYWMMKCWYKRLLEEKRTIFKPDV